MPYAPHSTRRTAFTLIELIAVMLIMGIMAAVAVPSFAESLMYHRVEAAALRLKNDLELVRNTAVTASTNRSLQFTTGSAYTLPNINSLDHPGQAYSVDLAQPPWSVQVLSVDFGGSTSVNFNGYGMPASVGTVLLKAGSHSRQITLDTQGQVLISKL